MDFKKALIVAITFGVVAAAVVWWLERFELNRLHGEVLGYLKNQDDFREFLRTRESSNE